MIEYLPFKMDEFKIIGLPPKLLSLLLFITLTNTVYGQFIQFSMTIDTEVGATVESSLDFGILNPNESTIINLGDASMGIFSIRGLPTQYVSVELDIDEYLIHAENPGCRTDVCRIKVNLNAAYANQGQSVGDIRGIVPITGNAAFFPILQSSRRPTSALHTSFLYLYGSLDIEDVMPGTYIGFAKLIVEFQ
jgi:hypothetical protein